MFLQIFHFEGGKKKKDKKETDDTCVARGTSCLGGLAWELLPELQPLVPG